MVTCYGAAGLTKSPCHRRDNAVAVDHLTAELLDQSGIGLSVEYHEDAGTCLGARQRGAESDV